MHVRMQANLCTLSRPTAAIVTITEGGWVGGPGEACVVYRYMHKTSFGDDHAVHTRQDATMREQHRQYVHTRVNQTLCCRLTYKTHTLKHSSNGSAAGTHTQPVRYAAKAHIRGHSMHVHARGNSDRCRSMQPCAASGQGSKAKSSVQKKNAVPCEPTQQLGRQALRGPCHPSRGSVPAVITVTVIGKLQ